MFMIMLLLISTSIVGQTQFVSNSPVRIGFGIAFHDLYEWQYLSYEAPSFYLPIDFGKYLIEPSISHERSRKSTIDYREETERVTILGLGVFVKKNYEKSYVYAGSRIGYGTSSYSYQYMESSLHDRSLKESVSFIAPTIGGQYFFSSHFSLGGEGGVRFDQIFIGNDTNGKISTYKNEKVQMRIILRFIL